MLKKHVRCNANNQRMQTGLSELHIILYVNAARNLAENLFIPNWLWRDFNFASSQDRKDFKART